MSAPEYGDGITYVGECLCHGIEVWGVVARSRPHPYMTTELLGGASVRVVLLHTNTGAHDVPVKGIKVRGDA